MVEFIAELVALIAACLLPLAFLVSQRLRRSSERRRAIRRLLRLAAEEAVRADFEASAVTWIGPVEALILCILWMLPLVVFLIHRRWQESAERSRRIELLQEQPSAEQPSAGYTMHSPPYYLCPVCRRAAPLICSGCRVFRYCSLECQSIHWRNGHGQQCRYYRSE